MVDSCFQKQQKWVDGGVVRIFFPQTQKLQMIFAASPFQSSAVNHFPFHEPSITA